MTYVSHSSKSVFENGRVVLSMHCTYYSIDDADTAFFCIRAIVYFNAEIMISAQTDASWLNPQKNTTPHALRQTPLR